MGFVFKSAFYLYLLLTCSYAYKICKIPNGGAGICIKISSCQPLYDIYNRISANETENLFLRQSICSHSDSPTIKVCCLDQSRLSEFRVNPVLFPNSHNSPKETNEVNPTVTSILKPNLLAIPDTAPVNRDRGTDSFSYGMKEICGKDSASSNKITGGNVTSIDQYPWLAILEYSGVEIGLCGGSLINKRFVLTAAHCIRGSNGKPQSVRLAEYDTKTSPTDHVYSDGGGIDNITQVRIAVERTYPHPEYDSLKRINDIGLIKMREEVEYGDFIKPICLPQVDYVPSFNTSTILSAAGWGTDNGKENTIKLEVSLPYVPLETCRLTQSYTLSEKQVCAGGEGGKDTCTGDSGGPLMHEVDKKTFYVLGVVSYGPKRCGTLREPAVYTHVYQYRHWIDNVLRGDLD